MSEESIRQPDAGYAAPGVIDAAVAANEFQPSETVRHGRASYAWWEFGVTPPNLKGLECLNG